MAKSLARWLLGAAFVVAGANHFLHPALYLEMMPPWLPGPQVLIQLSGAAEILLGALAIFTAAQCFAGWGLIALLIAVFPANVQIALHGFRGLPGWVLWARLPLQGALVAWVYWCCLAPRRPPAGFGNLLKPRARS